MSSDAPDNPLTDFSGCHVGIIKTFTRLGELPRIAEVPEEAESVRKFANEIQIFFRDVVLSHHTDEENELFVAVRRVLDKHLDQALKVSGYIGRLTEEHRHLERLWQIIEPDLKKMGKGKAVKLNSAVFKQLSEDYLAHADFEERCFLPLAEQLLSGNDLSALGMSLHIRHSEPLFRSYI